MRFPRAAARCLSILIGSLSLGARAHGELLVITTPGTSPALSHAELALATGAGSPVTWLSLRVRRGPVAVVAALPESASGEPALDAWLSALEASGSPNVLLPLATTDCGKSSSFVHVSWPRSPGAGAEELTLANADDVAATLAEHGLGEEVRVPEAARYLVWVWPSSTADETTRTLRVVGDGASLSFSPLTSSPVVVTTLSPGPLQLPGELGAEQLFVTFVAGKPSSDYFARLVAWQAREQAPLLEARARGLVFDWSLLAGTVSLPPLVRHYARIAAKERDDVDMERCIEELQAFQRAEAPLPTACGSATDAALAFAATGAGPSLQRFVTSGSEPIGIESFVDGGEVSLPVLRAAKLDDGACPPLPKPPVILPPSSGGGNAPSVGGGGIRPEEDPVAEEPVRTSSEGCSCSPSRDPYYDEQSTVHCSGDTSSSGDDSCSSDSSGSSEDDSCSSDSSGSSGDDSCSGSSDSGYDGDTCNGRAAPAAEPKDAHARLSSTRTKRPARLRLSLWSLALAATLLPIRRRKRVAGGSG